MSEEPDWSVPRRIDSPSELTQVIETVSRGVRAGTLRQLTRESSVVASRGDFLDLPAAGPWGDYLEYYFEDTRSGAEFTLKVETYHGCGGSWEPAD